MCWHPEQARTYVLSKKIVSFVRTLIFMKIKDVMLMAVVPKRKLGADAGFLERGPYVKRCGGFALLTFIPYFLNIP